MANEKIFFDEAGAKVSSTMFVDPSGDQYPIRNITSVQVRYKPLSVKGAKISKWVGIVVAAIGVIMAVTGEVEVGIGWIGFGLLGVYIWWANKILIHLGAGGVQQEAYSHPARDNENVERVQRLATAINDAIAHIQK